MEFKVPDPEMPETGNVRGNDELADAEMAEPSQAPADVEMAEPSQAPADVEMAEPSQAPADVEMAEPSQACGNVGLPEPQILGLTLGEELTCQLDKGKAVFSAKDGSLKLKSAKSDLQLKAGTVGTLMRALPFAQRAIDFFDTMPKKDDGVIWSRLLSANSRQKQSLEVRAFKEKAYLFVCSVFRAQAAAQVEEEECADPRLRIFLEAEKEFKENGYWYQNVPYQLTSADVDALYPFVTEGLKAMQKAQN